MIKRAKQEGKLIWSFPGRKVEANKTKEQACIREVYEETGITVKIKKHLGGERTHPNTDTILTYFLCEYVSGETTILNKDEILEISYKSKNEFYRDTKLNIFLPVKKYIDKNII